MEAQVLLRRWEEGWFWEPPGWRYPYAMPQPVALAAF